MQITAFCRNKGMVTPFDQSLVNPASLDVRLGSRIRIESATTTELILLDLEKEGWTERTPYLLRPGQFILAETIETFNIPNDVAAQFVLKSSRAREGIEHLLAGFADPGFHGSVLTLELHNSRQLHPVPIWPGMKIGQLVFYQMSQEPQVSYAIKGHYNNDKLVTGSKGHI